MSIVSIFFWFNPLMHFVPKWSDTLKILQHLQDELLKFCKNMSLISNVRIITKEYICCNKFYISTSKGLL